jgi:hypothetical protein
MSVVDQMEIRYTSILDLLHVARSEKMVIRSNSLAGVFKWTPDDFERERNAGAFPAKCDPINFWLQPIDDCLAGLMRDIQEKRNETAAIEAEMAVFIKYCEGAAA